MQVIAHRANTLEAINDAWSMGCHLAEVDVHTGADGRLLITRDPAAGGVQLEPVLARSGGLYLDVKSAVPEVLAKAVRGRAATWIWSARLDFLTELRALDPSLALMPQAHSRPHMAQATAALAPRAFAFAAWDYHEELIRLAQSSGALTFVDLLKDLDTEVEWRRARRLGVNGVMTDRPGELLRWLEANR
jgi:glycerophosphoryl diester phosphodiesterase